MLIEENVKTTNCNFVLLRDEVTKEDFFENRTHENVAKSIFELIKTQIGGVTIGLEGSWGSGKSTVIAILKEKLCAFDKSCHLIQFDAWAHQGDPLRRIFLESLIDDIALLDANHKEKLTKLKEAITNRKKKININTTRTTTSLGKIIAISTFFVPIGLGWLSLTKNLTITWGGEPNYWFLFSSSFLFAPLWVLLGNLIRLLIKKKKILDEKNWAFLKEDSTQDITQEVSEDEERSSIEFEKYFEEIVKIYLSKKDRKLIIVIDNLDRVDPKDSLTIWSTLQTFLQQRSNIKLEDWFRKLWIVIPYDKEGLEILWRQKKRGNETDDDDVISKSFFEKNFQIRFEVPEQIFSGWVEFTKRMIDEALKSWDEEDKNAILQILRLTRKDLSDSPKPRQIKNYINQIAALGNQYHNIVPVTSIAYYVITRFVQNESSFKIKENLILGLYPDPKQLIFLPPTCKKDIAGLLFGVTPEKGNQLLLEPEIQKYLENGDSESLNVLHNTYGKDFWPVFNYHLKSRDLSFRLLFKYSLALAPKLWNEAGGDKKEILTIIENAILNSNPEQNFVTEINKEAVLGIINICIDNPGTLKTFYRKLVIVLRIQLQIGKTLPQNYVELYSEIVAEFLRIGITIKKYEVDFSSILFLKEWCKTSLKNLNKLWLYIVPSRKYIDETINLIQPSVTIENGVTETLKYVILSKEKINWDICLDVCDRYINYNNANFANHSGEIFEIITIIGITYQENQNPIKTLISKGHYYHLLNQMPNNLLYAAIIFAYIFKENLQTANISQYRESYRGVDLIKNFWKTSDIENANRLYAFIKLFNIYDFIWDVAADKSNKLVKDIIDVAIEDDLNNELFTVDGTINKLKNYLDLETKFNSEKFQKLIDKFIDYSDIENELESNEMINVNSDVIILTHFVIAASNSKLINKFSISLGELKKEDWINAFNKINYLLYFALEVKKKNDSFMLQLNYFDAMFEFCTSSDQATKYVANSWPNLFTLLSETYQTEFYEKVTIYYKEKKGTVSNMFLSLCGKYLSKKEILEEQGFLEKIIDKTVEDRNYERLRQILSTFNKVDVINYATLESKKLEIIKERIKLTLPDETEENINVLREIVDLLGLHIKKLDKEKDG